MGFDLFGLWEARCFGLACIVCGFRMVWIGRFRLLLVSLFVTFRIL